MNPLEKVVKSIFYWLIEFPLRSLYMNGPSFHEYGFWEGRTKQDICAQLVPALPADVWPMFETVCDDLIERKYQAFQTGVLMILYVYAFYQISRWTVRRWCRASPSRDPVPQTEPHLSPGSDKTAPESSTTGNGPSKPGE